MLKVTESRWSKTGSASSRLQFEIDRGDRHLLLDGKRAYHLGYGGCQTCAVLFERLDGANKTLQIEVTAEALRQGVTSLDDEVVSRVGMGLPEGEYALILAETLVEPVAPGAKNDYFMKEQIALWGEDTFWCLPHDPRVPYFRAGDIDVAPGKKLFNCVVPMIPLKWLSRGTVSNYKEALESKKSGTAVSIAILDIKSPECDDESRNPDPSEHWIFTHYLLDGHHKLKAAAEAEKPLRLLSFVALSAGVSDGTDVEKVIALLTDKR